MYECMHVFMYVCLHIEYIYTYTYIAYIYIHIRHLYTYIQEPVTYSTNYVGASAFRGAFHEHMFVFPHHVPHNDARSGFRA